MCETYYGADDCRNLKSILTYQNDGLIQCFFYDMQTCWQHISSMSKKKNLPWVIYLFFYFFFAHQKFYTPLKFLEVQICLDLKSFSPLIFKNYGRFYDLFFFSFFWSSIKNFFFFSLSIFLKTCYGMSKISLKLTLE